VEKELRPKYRCSSDSNYGGVEHGVWQCEGAITSICLSISTAVTMRNSKTKRWGSATIFV